MAIVSIITGRSINAIVEQAKKAMQKTISIVTARWGFVRKKKEMANDGNNVRE